MAFKRFVDNIPDDVKKRRNNELLAIQNQIAYEHHQKMIGQDFTVLCEGESKLEREIEPTDLVQLVPLDKGW